MTPEATPVEAHAPFAVPLTGTSMSGATLDVSRQQHASFLRAAPHLAAARRPEAPVLDNAETLDFTPEPTPAPAPRM